MQEGGTASVIKPWSGVKGGRNSVSQSREERLITSTSNSGSVT